MPTDHKNSNSEGASKQFHCSACGNDFSMSRQTLERFPGWAPTLCPRCYSGKGKNPRRGKPIQGSLLAPVKDTSRVEPVVVTQQAHSEVPDDSALRQALDQVLEDHSEGPTEGVFTDGASHGNPGPGGWGTVHVRDDQVVSLRYGRSPDTTNNRMELRALIAAYEMLGPDDQVTIWSDSQLCVNTINLWATGWKRRGWKRKGGAIKNLDLVKPLYELSRTRPGARLTWIKAHVGLRWNEYADTLADPEL